MLVFQSPLLIPEYCYNANPTLHSNSLWKNPKTISQAVALRDAWKLTLQNHGCSGLVNVSGLNLLEAFISRILNWQNGFLRFEILSWIDIGNDCICHIPYSRCHTF